MKLGFAVFSLSSLAVLSVAHADSVKWNLDPTHTHVGFKVKHLAVSNVKGEFKDFSATISADAQGHLDKVEATAKTASVSTDNSKRDDHLKSDDFFAADKFPELKITTKSFKWDGNNFTAEADLTIRGTTKPVTFKGELTGPSKVNFGDGAQLRVGYTATTKVNRKDFGLNWNKVLEAVQVVGDEVTIEIEVEASRKAS